MGVRKTYSRVLEKFFWPRVKRSVAEYSKTCHTCQRVGEQNRSVNVTPMFPNLEKAQPKAAKVEQPNVCGRGPVRAVLSSDCGVAFSVHDTRTQNARFGKACACVSLSHNALSSSHPVCIYNAHRKEKHGKSHWKEYDAPHGGC